MTKEKTRKEEKWQWLWAFCPDRSKLRISSFWLFAQQREKVKIAMLKDNLKCKTCYNDYTGINNQGYTFLFSFNYCQGESVLVERHNPQRRKKV